ncbi:hypothetical protein K504DRAFT_491353 [Pleomassaria siparia CBS 279.74]|uniref:Uncharacterized protein n=1 Tax=Pleomassaria siparia CBS 279.74 TaxID=1314801 RepID=A0A6G1K706_9PLEO|nr:hypothetical protein K504DRAFT_491353 [Pleomassaria siparia CBS 279.74]
MDQYINSSNACLPSADNVFGPTIAAPCRSGFDFTFTFEQYLFTIVSSALVLIAAPPRFYFLSRLQPNIEGKEFKLVKLDSVVGTCVHAIYSRALHYCCFLRSRARLCFLKREKEREKQRTRCFHAFLGPKGLLRRRNTTVILATHSQCEVSAITPIGSLSSVIKVASLNKAPSPNSLRQVDTSLPTGIFPDIAEGQSSSTPDFSASRGEPGSTKKDDSVLDKSRQTSGFVAYRYYFAQLSWKIGSIFLLFQVAYAFLTTFPTVWLKWWGRRQCQVSQCPRYALHWRLCRLSNAGSGCREDGDGGAVYLFFSTTDSGTTLTRFSQEMQLLDMSLPLALQVVVVVVSNAHSNDLVDGSQKPFYLVYTVIQRWLSLVLDLIIAALAVMVVGGVSVGFRDAISPGFTGVSLTLSEEDANEVIRP